MANIFPGGRILPVRVDAPGQAQSPRPLLPPGVAEATRDAMTVADSTQCVEFQSFVLYVPANLE